MTNNSLLIQLEQAFSEFKKPSIVYSLSEQGVADNERLAIQQDFGGILIQEMTDELCSIMICDSPLISDAALCYFLPRIARMVLEKRGLEYLLYSRLEGINQTVLNEEQKAVLNRFILTLKEIEQELEMQEKKELEQYWKE